MIGCGPTADVSLVPDPTIDQVASNQDTCEIYAAIITTKFAADTLIIAAEPETFPCGSNDSKGKPGLPFPFDGRGSYVLLAGGEVSELFRDRRNGWTEFARHYPKSNGIITLGPVEINREGNQAVVSGGYQCESRCGSGSTFTLRKTNGRWFIFSQDGGYVL